MAFNSGQKVGLFALDVSGAFDKISSPLLIRKLKSLGLPDKVIAVISSWFRDRSAYVIVGGQYS